MSKQVERIKLKLREEILKRISQNQLSKIMGVDRRVINRQLTGAFEKTSVNKLIEMLEATGLEIEINIKEKD